MSSVTVLCPNAHRVIIKTTPNTSILKILEDACVKYKYNPDNYTLRHLKRLLDVTGNVRFSAIPNRCILEMVELNVPRTAQPVTVCIFDEEGNKHVQKYPPTVTLWSLLEESKVCSSESLNDMTVDHSLVYSMNKIAGKTNLMSTTLKQLGLSSGGGSMRYSCQKNEPASSSSQSTSSKSTNEQQLSRPDIQATSAPSNQPILSSSDQNIAGSRSPVMPEVIPIAMPEVIPNFSANSQQRPEIIPDQEVAVNNNNPLEDIEMADNSREDYMVADSDDSPTICDGSVDIISPDIVSSSHPAPDVIRRTDDSVQPPDVLSGECSSSSQCPSQPPPTLAFSGASYSLSGKKVKEESDVVSVSTNRTEELPSQLMEVDSTQDTAKISLTSNKCVVYRASDSSSYNREFENEGDDFFDLTRQDVQILHREHLQKLKEMSDAPLLTAGLREAEQQARLLATINKFPVTQLRIHFPNDMVVQARFKPTDTVQSVATFVSTLLTNEAMEFELLTSYPRRPVDRDAVLHTAGLVPKARLYFSTNAEGEILKSSVRESIVSYEEAVNDLVGQRNKKSSVGLGCENSTSQSSISSGQSSYQTPSASGFSSRSNASSSSSAGATKKPKWFKLGK